MAIAFSRNNIPMICISGDKGIKLSLCYIAIKFIL